MSAVRRWVAVGLAVQGGTATVTAMMALSALMGGCMGMRGMSRGAEPAPDERGAANVSMTDGAGSGATEGGGVPAGSKSAEEIAAQMERDLVEFQQLNTAGRVPARSGAAASNGAPEGAFAAHQRAPTSSGIATPDRAASSPAGSNTGAPVIGAAPPRGVEHELDAATEAAESTAAPTPGLSRRAVPETPEALANAAAALYRDASRADTPLRSLMALAALSIADPERPFNAEALPDLTEEERRTLARFHGFCRDLGRQLASSDDPEAVSRAVEELSQEIRGERRLRIPRSEVCTQVEGFGVFTRIEPPEFTAHSGARFVLYSELDGYRSTEVGGEGWKTELSVELSILSERDGVPVWRRDWQSVTDLVATRRQDFFMTFRVNLPDALSVGAYALKIRVRDEQTGALAEHSVPFRMVAGTASRSTE